MQVYVVPMTCDKYSLKSENLDENSKFQMYLPCYFITVL